MKRRSRRNIAAFAKIQNSPSRVKYLYKQRTKVDDYTDAYMVLLKGATGDKIIS